MKYCTSLNGVAISIAHYDHLDWKASLNVAFGAVQSRVRSEQPTTPSETVDAVITALSGHLSGLSIEDTLELSAVVEYPGEADQLPETVATAETVEAVLNEFAQWQATTAEQVPVGA